MIPLRVKPKWCIEGIITGSSLLSSAKGVYWNGRLVFFRCFAGILKSSKKKSEFGIQNLFSLHAKWLYQVHIVCFSMWKSGFVLTCDVDSLSLAFAPGRCSALAVTCCILQAVGEFSKCLSYWFKILDYWSVRHLELVLQDREQFFSATSCSTEIILML